MGESAHNVSCFTSEKWVSDRLGNFWLLNECSTFPFLPSVLIDMH